MEKHVSGINDSIEASLERRPICVVGKALFASIWQWEHWRDGELIDKWAETNICTDEGLTSMLLVYMLTYITQMVILISMMLEFKEYP